MTANLKKTIKSVNISSIIADSLTIERNPFGNFYQEERILNEIKHLVSQVVRFPDRFYTSLTEATKSFSKYQGDYTREIFYDLEILRSLTFQLVLLNTQKCQDEILKEIQWATIEMSQCPERIYSAIAESMIHCDDVPGSLTKQASCDLEVFRSIMFRLALLKNKSAA